MFSFGLAVGSGDEYQVAHNTDHAREMVGRRVAVFVSLETGGLAGRASPRNKAGLRLCMGAGGIAIIARSEGEAESAIMELDEMRVLVAL